MIWIKILRNQVVKDNYEVAQPAFELQKAIRRKVLGVKYWEKMTKQRTKMFASYDQVGKEGCSRCENVWKEANNQSLFWTPTPPLILQLAQYVWYFPPSFSVVLILKLSQFSVFPYLRR